eukprot:9832489-Alexandrium_andersonii.AAC.1
MAATSSASGRAGGAFWRGRAGWRSPPAWLTPSRPGRSNESPPPGSPSFWSPWRGCRTPCSSPRGEGYRLLGPADCRL